MSPRSFSNLELDGLLLKQEATLKNRNELEAKMASVFGEKVNKLSTELQKILIDDMVTAFENRLNVLKQANNKAAN